MNKIGTIPEFTSDSTPALEEEVKQEETSVEETDVEERETPSEPPAENEPPQSGHDTGEIDKVVERATKGLRDEIVELRKKLREPGANRQNIQQDIVTKQQEIDELGDIDPNDVALIERVARAKGLMTKEEYNRSNYETVKNDQLNQFLETHPEYKAENDPNNYNWDRLQREIGSYYKMPDDPRLVGRILEMAHRGISQTSSDPQLAAKKRQIQTASVGGSGHQRSSPGRTPNPQRSALVRTHLRGGWSEDEIKEIESNF